MSESVIYINGLCRCCHARGSCRSLGVPYMLGDGQEIYAAMIRETFDIIISPESGEDRESTFTICESCIISLRDAARFKQQVLSCEEKLHKLLLEEDIKFQIGSSDDGEADGYSSEDSIALKPIEIIDDYYVGADGRVTKGGADSTPSQLEDDVDGEADGYSYSNNADLAVLEPKVEIDEQQEAPSKPNKPTVVRKRKIGTKLTPQDNSDEDSDEAPSRQKRIKGRTTELPNTESNERPCRICKKQISYRGLANHMKIHRKDYVKGRLFTCYMCRYQTTLYNDYLQHYELKHFDGNGYPCNACGGSFGSAKSLREHYNEHYENEIVKCGKCEKNVKRKCLLKHSKIHTGRYICNICNQRCPTKQSLIRHTSKHERMLANVCDVCGQTFSSNLKLKNHKLKQHVKKSDADSASPKQKNRKGSTTKRRNTKRSGFFCNICNKKVTERDLKPHVKRHLKEIEGGLYTCRICRYQSKNYTEYLEHYELKHFDGDAYPCSACDASFTSAKLLKKHYYRHYKNETVKCNECNKELKRSSLRLHYISHTEQFICDICGNSYNNKYYLIRHMYTHTGRLPDLCDICGHSFKDKCHLKRHISRVHHGELPHACCYCTKRFFNKNSLKSHEAQHTGNRPFVCEICNRSYAQKNALKVHMTVHVEGKPFSCRFCDLKFKQKDNLKKHENRHIGAKKFNCDVCKKQFFRKHDLKTHMRSHTGEKPYECKMCSKNFAYANGLRRHNLFKHSTEIRLK